VIALALAALQFDKFEQSGHVDLAFLDLREERESRVWKDAGTEWEDRIL
jgi:hypothetical protein